MSPDRAGGGGALLVLITLLVVSVQIVIMPSLRLVDQSGGASSQRSGGSGVLSCANELARGSCKFSLIGLKSLRSGFKYTAAALAPIAR